jgi:putative photosynthetic complex assembly protein
MSLVNHSHEQTVPKGAIWFAVGMIGFTLIAAGTVRLGLAPVAASPVAVRTAAHLAPTATRSLSFADRADGGLVITDTASGVAVAPGEPSGFIRGMLRGLGRERRMKGVAPATPFRLESWSNGQLSLTDTGTGRSIELSAFGSTNRAEMARLLK